MAWKVWGSDREPLYQGAEADAKEFVEKHPEGYTLYIQSPEGDELIYEDGEWVVA